MTNHDPFEIASHTKAVDLAKRRLAACQQSQAEAQKRAEQAQSKLDAARTEVTRFAAELAAAKEAYAADPSDRLATAIARAREALELAELRAAKPAQRASDADEAVRKAAAAVDDATRELHTAEETLAVATLRQTASLDQWMQTSGPLYNAAVEAERAAKAAKQALLDAFNVSRSASAKLREKGYSVPEAVPLGDVHLVSAAALARSEREPSTSGTLLDNLVASMPQAELLSVVEYVTRTSLPTNPDVRPLLAELLAIRAPTQHDGHKIAEREREKQAQANFVKQAKAEAEAKAEAAKHQVIQFQRARAAQAKKDAAEQLRKAREEAERKAALAKEQAEYQAMVEREKDELLRGGAA